MDENAILLMEKNIKCTQCGHGEYQEKDGYFYCEECGSKQEHIQAIELEQEYDPTEKVAKKQKIKKEATKIPDITSWECYNYILRGMVQELLNFHVKDDLKLMTLQIWSALLRRNEVAFFNRKKAELPRLGAKFLERDAKTLYNHQKNRKRSSRRGTSSLRSQSSDGTKREWRKSKRNLDMSDYSNITSDSSYVSSTSTGTGRAVIQLQFSAMARKFYKKHMTKKHLDKHTRDSEGVMNCHGKPKATDFKRSEYECTAINIKKLYAILGIALNLIEDQMQLSDLVRIIGEGSLFSSRNYVKYFPENIAPNAEKILKSIYCYSSKDKCIDKSLREHINHLAKYLNVKCFKCPDMIKLVERYVEDLNLPADVTVYAQRLINVLPPRMRKHVASNYPAYEARAMAYIIFILKLFYGLDDQKEHCISESAEKINAVLKDCEVMNSANSKCKPLFVFTKWMEFIEMRKIIISKYNSSFCQQFGQSQSTTQFLAQISQNRKENTHDEEECVEGVRTQYTNLQRVMELFLKETEETETFSFMPTLTPASDYFKEICEKISVPDFMKVSHAQCTFEPYFCTTEYRNLRSYLEINNYKLNFKLLSCQENCETIGIFKADPKSSISADNLRVEKADFNINTEEWLKNIKVEPLPQDLQFKTEHKEYHRNQILNMKKKLAQRKRANIDVQVAVEKVEHSIDVFNETDMNPLSNVDLNKPRSLLNPINLFEDLSDVEEENGQNKNQQNVNELTLVTSNFDCWTLLGLAHSLNELQKQELQTKFPNSFRWLLETCAQTICVDNNAIYEELLVLEVMFLYGVENLEDFQDCLHFRYNLRIKDFNVLVNSYRELW